MAGEVFSLPVGGGAAGAAIYLNADLNLRLTAFNSAPGVTLTVTTLLWDTEHGLQKSVEQVTPTTARAINTRTIQMGNGWLVGVQVVASAGTPQRGQCFARVEVILGNSAAAQSLVTVLQGYVQDTTALTYPGSPIEASTSGRGVIRSITGTLPSAGAEAIEAVPANARWRFLAGRVALAASAVVGNRVVGIVIDDGTSARITTGNAINQTASQTALYYALPGVPFFTYDVRAYHLPLPAEVMMAAGWRFKTATSGIDAGDQFTIPALTVEEWIED